jgi:hypothetical protein
LVHRQREDDSEMYWSGRREGGVDFSEGTQKYYIVYLMQFKK